MELQNSEVEYCIENAVIASLVSHNEFIDEISGELQPDDFSKQINREIYNSILDLQTKNELPIDFLLLSQKVQSERYNPDDIYLYIIELLKDHIFGFDTFKVHIAELKKISNRRKTMALLNETQKIIISNKHDGIEFLKKGIDLIENNKSVAVFSFSEMVDKTIIQIEKVCNSDSKLTGVSTGFDGVDKITGGLQRSNLIILAARPSMGKTALALNMAQNMACHNKKPVVFFSLEMQAEEITKRSICRFASIEGERMFTGKLTSDDWKAIQFCKPFLDQSKLFINDRSMMTVSEMRSYCRKVKNNHGLDAIFIDYISFVQVLTDTDTEVRRLALISSQLKSLAKDFDVPVVVLSQLNRNTEKREDKRPIMADIRDSGAIEQDADMIMFLYREEKYIESTHKRGESELIIDKNRNGKTGTVLLNHNLARFEFMNYGSNKG